MVFVYPPSIRAPKQGDPLPIEITLSADPEHRSFGWVPGQGYGHGPLRRPKDAELPTAQTSMLRKYSDKLAIDHPDPETREALGRPTYLKLGHNPNIFRPPPTQAGIDRPDPPPLESVWVPQDLEEWPFRPYFWRGLPPVARRVVGIITVRGSFNNAYAVQFVNAGPNPGYENVAKWHIWWRWIMKTRSRNIPGWTRQWPVVHKPSLLWNNPAAQRRLLGGKLPYHILYDVGGLPALEGSLKNLQSPTSTSTSAP